MNRNRRLTGTQRVRLGVLRNEKEIARLRAARLDPIIGLLENSFDALLFSRDAMDQAEALTDTLRAEQGAQEDVMKLRGEEIKAIEE